MNEVEGRVSYDRNKMNLHIQKSSRARYASILIVTGFAGYIAELKAKPLADEANSERDIEKTNELLRKHFTYERKLDRETHSYRRPTETEIKIIINRRGCRLWLIAERLVHRFYPIVVIVARALIEQRKLTGHEVRAIAEPMIAKERADLTSVCHRAFG